MAMDHDCDELPKEKAALATFFQLCAEKNLLGRPDGLQDDDANFAINDETTLLYCPSQPQCAPQLTLPATKSLPPSSPSRPSRRPPAIR